MLLHRPGAAGVGAAVFALSRQPVHQLRALHRVRRKSGNMTTGTPSGVISLDFVSFTACHAPPTRALGTCGEANEIDLTTTHPKLDGPWRVSRYSKRVSGGASGLHVSWPSEAKLALVFHNNKRNVQIPTSTVKMSITWGGGAPGPWDPSPAPSNTLCENIWSRPLANGDVALAMVNQGANATVTCDTACFAAAGLAGAKKVKVRDMIAHADLPALSPPFELKATVHGQGAAAAFRLTPSK